MNDEKYKLTLEEFEAAKDYLRTRLQNNTRHDDLVFGIVTAIGRLLAECSEKDVLESRVEAVVTTLRHAVQTASAALEPKLHSDA